MSSPLISRRKFVTSGVLAAPALTLSRFARGGSVARQFSLEAAESRNRLVPEPYSETAVWCYNGQVPGAEIRLKQGERVRIGVTNRLQQPTTVHWHGIRTPNAMDGVPFLTQAPINTGETFSYEFDVPDAGTYWYHPHMQSVEQLARGLYGPLIVEERNPIRVDRDITWLLDDWRLRKSAQIDDAFDDWHDMTHAGRFGNTVTINGRITRSFDVRPGERIRLRLINAANARIFGLDFGGLRPWIIAVDGQPVKPEQIDDQQVTVGPAMRVDLVIDMDAQPGKRFTVKDRFSPRRQYDLVDLVCDGETVRTTPPDWPLELDPNPLAQPTLDNAERHNVVFTGGAMGHGVVNRMGITLTEKMRKGMDAMRDGTHDGRFWFINGEAVRGHLADPMLTLRRNRSYILAMTNATAWHHPIHLHGHSFRLLSRNGAPLKETRWHDTVLMAPQERVEIALVADNPGDWMFHCHILEHMAAGMMGIIRVA